jgi:hypothetical protein
MDFGTSPEELERCRRSLTMAPPQSSPPCTSVELLMLVSRLQIAEAEVRRLRQGG